MGGVGWIVAKGGGVGEEGRVGIVGLIGPKKWETFLGLALGSEGDSALQQPMIADRQRAER